MRKMMQSGKGSFWASVLEASVNSLRLCYCGGMGAEPNGGELLVKRSSSSRVERKQRGMIRQDRIYLLLVTLFPWGTSPPNNPRISEIINGWIHWWGQSPYDPFTSPKPAFSLLLLWGLSLQHLSLWGTFWTQTKTRHGRKCWECCRLTPWRLSPINTHFLKKDFF